MGRTEEMLVRAASCCERNNNCNEAELYNQMFTMNGLTMIFLVI